MPVDTCTFAEVTCVRIPYGIEIRFVSTRSTSAHGTLCAARDGRLTIARDDVRSTPEERLG